VKKRAGAYDSLLTTILCLLFTLLTNVTLLEAIAIDLKKESKGSIKSLIGLKWIRKQIF
jgi:hypothetical protein